MTIMVAAILALFGAALGSFAAAQVWRLRAHQLRADIAAGEVQADDKEYKKLKPLLENKIRDDHSRCLSCGHQLAWYDLLPIVSWLSLKGRCRYCHASIGRFELSMEIGVGAFFALSYLAWPQSLGSPLEITHFGLWLIAGVVLAIHVAYDAKWFLLLDTMNSSLATIGLLYAITGIMMSGEVLPQIASLIGAIAVMSGIYGLLYILSKGAWIGLGDVKLGVGLGLLLGSWQMAFVGLFAANLIGCLVILPGMMSGKLTRKSRIPFGPFLIAGTVVGVLWGQAILTWYVMLLPGLFS